MSIWDTFFKGPKGDPGPMGPQGSIDSKPYIAYTHCNLCNNLTRCTRVGNHLICTSCEMNMFNRIKLIIDFS